MDSKLLTLLVMIIYLLALSFDGTEPRFNDNAKTLSIEDETLTILYSKQCPYIPNCIKQIEDYCKTNDIPLNVKAIDTLKKQNQFHAFLIIGLCSTEASSKQFIF